MQCHDVRKLADSFLSEELMTETNHEILRHLETCPECRADLADRRVLRNAVRTAFMRSADLKADPRFVSELHERLRATALGSPRRQAKFVLGWWALAASLLVAVATGGAFWMRGRIASHALAIAAAGDHQNCAVKFRLAEKPIPLEEAARRYDAAYRVLETLPPNTVATTAGLARVVERHACVYDGRRFAHVVLQYQGEVVSLLVTESDGRQAIAIPEEARPPLTDGRVGSLSVVSFQTRRHAIFLVSALARADLDRLADAVAGPLSRQLAGL